MHYWQNALHRVSSVSTGNPGGDNVASFASRDLYETISSGSCLRVGFPGRGLGSSGGGRKGRSLTSSLSGSGGRAARCDILIEHYD